MHDITSLDAPSAATSPLLAVRFSVATQLLGDATAWPDDYHRAVYWLRTVYDDVEDQLSSDHFRLARLERSLDGLVAEVEDSLTEAPLETVCSDLGFEFNSDILLCGRPSTSRRFTIDWLLCLRISAVGQGTNNFSVGIFGQTFSMPPVPKIVVVL